MRVLAVSAHPDDETLGAGGTLLKHLSQGDELYWAIVTVGHPDDYSEEHINQAIAQVEEVAKRYEFRDVFRLELPSTRLDTIPKRNLIESFLNVLVSLKPSVIYTVGDYDVHTDHYWTYEALMLALKPFRADIDVKEIYAYEVLSSTEAAFGFRRNTFAPNVYVDISNYMDRKLEIFELYENELMPEPLPRCRSSVEALARYRGAAIGVEYAEAFQMIRKVW